MPARLIGMASPIGRPRGGHDGTLLRSGSKVRPISNVSPFETCKHRCIRSTAMLGVSEARVWHLCERPERMSKAAYEAGHLLALHGRKNACDTCHMYDRHRQPSERKRKYASASMLLVSNVCVSPVRTPSAMRTVQGHDTTSGNRHGLAGQRASL